MSIPGITNGRVDSNDLVELLSENTFQWLGRIDNVINSGGIKIIPEELESKISFILGFEVLVAGLPDQSLGQKLVLLIEEKKAYRIGEIENILSEQLVQADKPREIIPVKEFYRNDSFKIDRKRVLSELPED